MNTSENREVAEEDIMEPGGERTLLASENAETADRKLDPSVADAIVKQDESAKAAIEDSLVELGFIAFDGSAPGNATSGAMVSENRRRHFRRDTYVGIKDQEQGKEFLGRVVEGPFHSPHEVGADSAITRTTLLHPERTRFRPTYYVHGSIEVLGEIVPGERVVPTPTRPRPYSEIYIFPQTRLRAMLGIAGDFYLGHLMGYSKVEVHADIESKNFLPRNVGIFGTIGSGKSNTTQVLMEEALRAKWAVIVVDVEGEYVRMNEQTSDKLLEAALHSEFSLEAKGVKDLRVYVPSSGSSDAEKPIQFKVPLSQLPLGVVADILEFTEPQVRMYGTITERVAKNAVPAGGKRLGVLAESKGQQAARPYSLGTLVDGLAEDEQGNIPLYPKIKDVERPTAHTLRSKLYDLGRSGVLDWGLTSNVPELPVDDLLVAGRLSVLDVSETDDRSRNIAIAYTLQALFDRVIKTPVGERMPNHVPRPRVLVVIEEVHTFVSRASAPKMRSVIDNLQIISRRGRKRWMALALVSQQPGHVPDELFELANTRFIHQLKSVNNLAPVKATTGGVHEALWSTVPALGPGQCLVSGAIFRNPIFVTIRPAMSRRLLSGD
jgi:DNA helicase HerA-like ATPase